MDSPDHEAPVEGAPEDGGEVRVDVHDLVPRHLPPLVRHTVEPAATQLGDPDRAGENSARVETNDWARGGLASTRRVLLTHSSNPDPDLVEIKTLSQVGP